MPKMEIIYLDEYSHGVHDHPRPAKFFLPDWYKSMESYLKSPENPNGNKIGVRHRVSNASAKKCVPMLDAMTAGYMVTLWADVVVEIVKGSPQINWRVQKNVFVPHGKSSERVTPPVGYSNWVFKYLNWFKVRTPKGYSIQILPPLNHHPLPFHAIPAVIDSDKSMMSNEMPMWLADGFEGIIEKGTPLAQIIPFKRENWNLDVTQMPYEKHIVEEDRGVYSTIRNNYRRNIWSRKSYK